MNGKKLPVDINFGDNGNDSLYHVYGLGKQSSEVKMWRRLYFGQCTKRRVSYHKWNVL